jgi:hypothetical protein
MTAETKETNLPSRFKVLDVLANMYASLPELIAWRAGYDNEDLPALVFRAAELYGIMETAGVLLGPECEKDVTEVLVAFFRYFEQALAYFIAERDDKKVIDTLDREMFDLKVRAVYLIDACLKGGAK